MDFKLLLDEAERLLVSGNGGKAKQVLTSQKNIKVPRQHALAYAKLAYRLNAPQLALKVLRPIVRSEKKVNDASPQEIIQYAAALSKVGSYVEAIQLLTRKELQQYAEALLFLSFAHFASWDYANSIPLLFQYVRSPQISDYQRLVGLANLAAALVYEQRAEAREVIDEIYAKTNEEKHPLVYGHALKSDAERAVRERDFAEASRLLEKAERIFAKTESIESFFVKKWQAILVLLKTGEESPLNSVVKEAFTRKHWETVRQCESYRAIARKDLSLCDRILVGTPYPHFRERFLIEYGSLGKRPETFLWSSQSNPRRELDLFNHRKEANKIVLAEGTLLHRLLIILTSDLYRPIKIATLFAELYPGEYFNIQSSPHRVVQAMTRLREWIRREKMPLSVNEEEGSYSLSVKDGFGIWLSAKNAPRQRSEYEFERIREELHDCDEFRAEDVARVLRKNIRTANRMIKKAMEEGLLTKWGAGNASYYSFSDKPTVDSSLTKKAA